MSSKRLFPLSSTREVSGGLRPRSSRSEPPAHLENVRLPRSLVGDDSEFQHYSVSGRSHRSIALGLALAFCVSASFWTGIAFMVARVWK
jgi:hypothetical protein